MEQNTQKWLDFRKNKIGASDAPIIMEVNPWTTPYQLWEQKTGKKAPKEENKAMARGKAMEAEARQSFQRLMQIQVEPKVRIHHERDWMIASLDGINKDGDVVVEIKCPGEKDHEAAMDGIIPEKYKPQLQHQMEVCGVHSIFYFSYNPMSYKLLLIERDNNYIKELLDKEDAFYKCMKNEEPPALIDRDYFTREDYLWLEMASKWKQFRLESKVLQNKEELLRTEILRLTGSMNCQGGGIRVNKVLRKGPIKYNTILELKQVDLEQYRGPITEYWKIGEI